MCASCREREKEAHISYCSVCRRRRQSEYSRVALYETTREDLYVLAEHFGIDFSVKRPISHVLSDVLEACIKGIET